MRNVDITLAFQELSKLRPMARLRVVYCGNQNVESLRNTNRLDSMM